MFFFSPWRVLTGRYIEWTRNVYCKVAAELYNILRMIKCLRLKYIPQPWPLCYVSHCSLIINRCKINEGNFHWDDDVGSSRSEVSIPETVIPRIWCFKKEIAVNTVETLVCAPCEILYSKSRTKVCSISDFVCIYLSWCPGRISDVKKKMIHHINLLETRRNLLYIRNQSVPRSKHFPPRL